MLILKLLKYYSENYKLKQNINYFKFKKSFQKLIPTAKNPMDFDEFFDKEGGDDNQNEGGEADFGEVAAEEFFSDLNSQVAFPLFKYIPFYYYKQIITFI